MKDEPVSRFDDGNDEASGILFHDEFDGLVAFTGGRGECLFSHGDGFHVLVEQGDVELVAFDDDFAVHGLVFAEFKDAAFVGAQFDAFMPKGEGCDEREEDEFGFHGVGWMYLSAALRPKR